MSRYKIRIGGRTYEMEVEKLDETAAVPGAFGISSAKRDDSGGADVNVRIIDPSVSRETVNDSRAVRSPMPGTIIRLYVRNGDTVKKNEPVLVLEAMKMENEITAPRTGVITGLTVEEKQSVQGGDLLFEIVD